MLVHVKYGHECGARVIEFSSNHFITANNVTEKVRLTYGTCSILLLFNEQGRELNSQEIIENAGVYTVDDQDDHVKGKRFYLEPQI